MDSNILLSKLVASPSELAWCQVYSTVNLYIVVSLKSQEAVSSITSAGKELFEKMQREYFSLDEKSLSNIKGAVEAATKELNPAHDASLVLAHVSENIVYIVIFSEGEVILKRGEKIASVAKGEKDQVVAFSGELKNDDILILETQDFSQKITMDKLSETMGNLSVSEISENLAPSVHNEPLGTEAAIILQYKAIDDTVSADTNPQQPEEEEKPQEQKGEKTDEKAEDDDLETLGEKTPTASFLSKIKLPKLGGSGGKKKIIILSIIILVILLAGSIVFERGRQENKKADAALAEILTPAQQKYNEAVELIDLNKSLALEEFTNLKTSLEEDRSKLKDSTSQRKQLDEFIGKVESKIGELGQGSTVANQKEIFNDASLVSLFEGSLVVSNSDGKIALLSKDGKAEDEYETENKGAQAIASNTTSVFVLGDEGITQTTKSNGTTKTAIEDAGGVVSLGTFGSNLYGLDSTSKNINKYAGSSFTKSNYLTGDTKLSDPTSMTIDASIWVLDGGEIKKFTRGTQDTFTATGVTKEFGDNAQITTDVDYDNIYVLDPTNARIVSIAKDGEFVNQYSWLELKSATSIAVDEPGKKIYVTINNKLYSFDL